MCLRCHPPCANTVLGSLRLLLLALVSMYAANAMIEAVRELRKRGVGVERGRRNEFQEVARLAFPHVNGTITLTCVFGQFGIVMSFFAFVIDVVSPLADFLRGRRAHRAAAHHLPPCLLGRDGLWQRLGARGMRRQLTITIMACAAGRIEEQGGITCADELHAADGRGAGLTWASVCSRLRARWRVRRSLGTLHTLDQ